LDHGPVVRRTRRQDPRTTRSLTPPEKPRGIRISREISLSADGKKNGRAAGAPEMETPWFPRIKTEAAQKKGRQAGRQAPNQRRRRRENKKEGRKRASEREDADHWARAEGGEGGVLPANSASSSLGLGTPRKKAANPWPRKLSGAGLTHTHTRCLRTHASALLRQDWASDYRGG
jgi:hypothetical protein